MIKFTKDEIKFIRKDVKKKSNERLEEYINTLLENIDLINNDEKTNRLVEKIYGISKFEQLRKNNISADIIEEEGLLSNAELDLYIKFYDYENVNNKIKLVYQG